MNPAAHKSNKSLFPNKPQRLQGQKHAKAKPFPNAIGGMHKYKLCINSLNVIYTISYIITIQYTF